MTKNEIQFIGVMITIMIILVYIQAHVNPLSPQIELDNVIQIIKCIAHCALECALTLRCKIVYPICLATC